MSDAKTVRQNEKNLSIQQELDQKAAQKNMLMAVVPYIGLAFIIVFFTIVTGGKFLSKDNLANLLNQGFVLALISIGFAFVYAHGGSDFSVGAVSGVAQLVCGLLMLMGCPLWLCILACIAVCIAGAFCTATITLVFGVHVFIGSMCVRTSFTGILRAATENVEIVVDYQKYSFMNNTLVKAAVLIAVIAIGYYLFNCTVVGKYNKALGGNPLTAIQAGISKRKLIYLAYILMGTCVGIASVFAFFRTGKVTAYSGNGYEFNVMMAIILGGFPLTGGDRGRISSTIIGAATVTCLANGLSLWGLDVLLISGVKGILFVIIVALSYDRSSGKLVS